MEMFLFFSGRPPSGWGMGEVDGRERLERSQPEEIQKSVLKD
jgi:hypothetical protein